MKKYEKSLVVKIIEQLNRNTGNVSAIAKNLKIRPESVNNELFRITQVYPFNQWIRWIKGTGEVRITNQLRKVDPVTLEWMIKWFYEEHINAGKPFKSHMPSVPTHQPIDSVNFNELILKC